MSDRMLPPEVPTYGELLDTVSEQQAEIERLEQQVEYWQKRHDVLRDRYASQWGNGR